MIQKRLNSLFRQYALVDNQQIVLIVYYLSLLNFKLQAAYQRWRNRTVV